MATSKNHHAAMVGARVAELLRVSYPEHRAKLIARQFDVSVPTAERWLAGKLPTSRHLAAMAALWGHRFIEVVFPLAVAAHDRLRDANAERRGAPTWAGDAGRRLMIARVEVSVGRRLRRLPTAAGVVAGWRKSPLRLDALRSGSSGLA